MRTQLANRLEYVTTYLQVCYGLCAFMPVYKRENAQIAAKLQTSCKISAHKLLTSPGRTACSRLLEQLSLKQAVY